MLNNAKEFNDFINNLIDLISYESEMEYKEENERHRAEMIGCDRYISNGEEFFKRIAHSNFGVTGSVAFKFILNGISERSLDFVKESEEGEDFTRIIIYYESSKAFDRALKELDGSIRKQVFGKEFVDELIENFKVTYALSINNDDKLSIYEQLNEEDYWRLNEINIKNVKSSLDKSASLVLGAGVSISSGAADWENLVTNLSKDIFDDLENGKFSGSLDTKFGGALMTKAQFYREIIGDKDYYLKVYNSLYSDNWAKLDENFDPNENNRLLKAIAYGIEKVSDNRSFKIITYNYDNHLEHKLMKIGVKHKSIFDMDDRINNELSIYHVHGYMPFSAKKSDNRLLFYGKSVKLTEDDYNNLYNDAYCWQIGIQLMAFRESTCIFIGSSLTDPNIRRLLRMVNKEKKKHYALMVKEATQSNFERMLRQKHLYEMGINTIWVNSIEELPEMVDTIFEQTRII